MNERSIPKGRATDQANRRIALYVVAAVLALIGLADSIYLTVEHLLGETVVCVATKGCSEVLSSKYSRIGPLPLASLGAVAYFLVFSLATLAAFGYSRVHTGFMLLVQAMFAVTLWLLLVQAFILHAYCDYCLLSGGVIVLLVVTAFGAALSEPRTQGQY